MYTPKSKSTIFNDPIFNLFWRFPTPEQLQSVRNHHDSEDVAYQCAVAVSIFQSHVHEGGFPSLDPEDNFLVAKIADDLQVGDDGFDRELQSVLTRLALSTETQRNSTVVDKRKDRVLDFYRWVACGRKDHEFQFIPHRLTIPGPSPPANGSVQIYGSTSPHNKLEFLTCRRQVAGLCCNEKPDSFRPALFCRLCAIRPAQDIPLGMKFYCDPDCAQRLSPMHEQECRGLTRLYRIVAIFTDIFQLIEERTCSVEIASITEADGLTTVQEKSLDRRAYLGFPIMQRSLRTGGSSEQWCVVEYELASAEWLHLTEFLIKFLFATVCTRIRRMIFQPKNAYKSMQRILPNGKHVFNVLQRHEILCFTLLSGKELAFDPVGGRYGWKEVLSPLADYVSQRVHFSYCDTEHLDPESLRKWLSGPEFRPDDSLNSAIKSGRELLYKKATRALREIHMGWLREQHPQRRWRFHDILDIPDAMFVELRRYTVDNVTQFVDAEVIESCTKAMRLFRDGSGAVQVTGDASEVAFWEEV